MRRVTCVVFLCVYSWAIARPSLSATQRSRGAILDLLEIDCFNQVENINARPLGI